MREQDYQLLEAIDRGILICPNPKYWDQSYKLLKRKIGNEAKEVVPLILAAWHASSDDDKSERLKAQIKLARLHGIETDFLEVLGKIPISEWVFRTHVVDSC